MGKWLQRTVILLGFFWVCWTLFQMRPDQDYLRQQQFKALFKELMPQVQARYPDRPVTIDTLYWPDNLKSSLSAQVNKWQKENPVTAASAQEPLVLRLKWSNTRWNDRLTINTPHQQFAAERIKVNWTSALPPLLAVTLALLTQRLVLSLFMAIVCGSLLAVPGQPLVGLLNVAQVHGLRWLTSFIFRFYFLPVFYWAWWGL